jgi:hypothetical protein
MYKKQDSHIYDTIDRHGAIDNAVRSQQTKREVLQLDRPTPFLIAKKLAITIVGDDNLVDSFPEGIVPTEKPANTLYHTRVKSGRNR